jgi:hypothetical protein
MMTKASERRKRTRAQQRLRREKNRIASALPVLDLDRMAAASFPQSTLEEIWDSERRMLEMAKDRFGEYWTHARGCTVFLSRCITSFDVSRMMFGHFFAHLKKHHTLALFSAARLHKVQAMMDLRQVLEAGASAAFAIANPEQEHFVDVDEQGILDPSQPLTRKRYAWLDSNYPDKSKWIADTKKQINESAAHANLVSANNVFRVNDAGDFASTPFFDVEDDYYIKTDLWLISCVALTLMDFFYGVNLQYKAIEFVGGFSDTVQRYAAANTALRDQMRQTDRYKAAVSKYGLPANVK